MEQEETPPETFPAPAKRKKPIAPIILGIVVLIGAIYIFKTIRFNAGHVATDDAYITTDIVPISARVPGNVEQVFAKDNQHVDAGEVLVQLDSQTFQADVDQAEANLAVAEAAARGANVDVSLTEARGAAQIEEAQSGLSEFDSQIAQERAKAQGAAADTGAARASVGTAEANVHVSEKAVQSKMSARRRIAEAAQAAEAQIASAAAAVDVAQANLASAEATSKNADQEAARARSLVASGAISQSQADTKATLAANAKAQVEVARQQIASAKAQLALRESERKTAQEEIREADDAIAQAKAETEATRQSLETQRKRVTSAQAAASAAQQAVQSAESRRGQAAARLHEAGTSTKQVQVTEAQAATAHAKIKQAQAALEAAKIALARTRIVAPLAGTISRRNVQPGQQLAVGQPLLAIVPDEAPWIVANFKETQIDRLEIGQTVEVEVDAVSGHKFKAHVDSLSRGTGATFALLPPDNATGNFTKVVQRLPVKIVFEPRQPDLDKLHPGLSATVVVSTSKQPQTMVTRNPGDRGGGA